MENLKLELTKLLGKKELSFGCQIQIISSGEIVTYLAGAGTKFVVQHNNNYSISNYYFRETDIRILNHPATLTDFHRCIDSIKIEGVRPLDWYQTSGAIFYGYEDTQCEICGNFNSSEGKKKISYDSSKELLEQSEETLKQIIELISNNK